MTDNTSVLLTSLWTVSLATAVSMTNVLAEPAPPSTQSNPASPPQESATSPQQRGILPDQPLKSKIRYECKNDNHKLSTVAHTERGTIELIVWESTYFGANWSPAKRCNTVTERLQGFSDQRLLRFVSTGSLNNYNVICIAEKTGDCIDQGLLITLEPQDQPNQVLRQLFNYRSSIRRGPQTKEIIDFQRLLNERTPIAVPESAIGGTTDTLPRSTSTPTP